MHTFTFWIAVCSLCVLSNLTGETGKNMRLPAHGQK